MGKSFFHSLKLCVNKAKKNPKQNSTGLLLKFIPSDYLDCIGNTTLFTFWKYNVYQK